MPAPWSIRCAKNPRNRLSKTIVVTELTVADIRQLLIDSSLQANPQAMSPEQQADTILDKMLLPGVDLAAVRQITGLDRAGLADFNQSELQTIADHCRALNPLFSGCWPGWRKRNSGRRSRHCPTFSGRTARNV
ncbi:hypothetical protein [Paludibacterium denitrificans]|uniref:Uncharacterized protein n=1 Tax=Paludibacterium denitrificans TaxID=2675226 RepID=A0A844G879_9NEIS|nr:hypothetical protein [Paludibacterium denitrificans]MTD32513.1 hypothetical protein [Paludibacterium denitrificans]